MARLFDANSTLKRLRNRYRLVIMNDDTFEEVVTLKLSRTSVYIGLSTLFVFLIGITIVFIAFTPLKYYIPGYGSRTDREKLMQLKIRADSLESSMQDKQAYWESIKDVLSGNTKQRLDTTMLDIPDPEKIQD